MNLKLLPDDGFDILVACALVSISLNPLLFQGIGTAEKFLSRTAFFRHSKRRFHKGEEGFQIPSPKVVVIGFGPIGKEVSHYLKKRGINPIIIEQNIDTVASMEAQDTIFFGDAAESTVLKDIHIEEASHLLITIPDTEKTVKIVHTARSANPLIEIIARSQYISDDSIIKELHVQNVCTETESMKAFLSLVERLFQINK